jgi:putative two-component system response regulator
MSHQPRLLLAGDSLFRSALVEAIGDDFVCAHASTVTEAAAVLVAAPVEVVLLDFRTPSHAESPADGLSICRRIKGAAQTLLLPVVAITDPSPEDLVAALDSGADQAVAWPPHRRELQARTRAAVRAHKATARYEDASQVIFALANAVEAKDAYTEGHTERVGALAVELGRLAGFDDSMQESLRHGGVLHDIGKIGIPNEILNKPGVLSTKERIVMNKHPIIGERICEPLRSLGHLLPIIRWHHERLDGSGYPDGLKGSAFPLPAQVLQLADIYDAVTTDRPYHRARTRDAAVDFLLNEARKGWRDAELVKLVGRAAATLNLGRTSEADIPPPPAPLGQWRTE